jgi:hypothetical protein
VNWFGDWTNDVLILIYAVEAAAVYWARRRFKQQAEIRRRAAATLFSPDTDGVRRAVRLATGCQGAIMLTSPMDGGLAWWTCWQVPTGDMVINTGWCRTRGRAQRILDRASDDAAASHARPGSKQVR